MYKLGDNYTSIYWPKNLFASSGLALYIKNDFNFTQLNELSIVNENIESLFIKITNTTNPITAGLVYRPPNGDIDKFNSEMENIITKLPDNNSYILGDYNTDLLDIKSRGKVKFEEMVISNGFVPLISISTHHKPGCNKTCIDNVITNRSAENILACGKVAGTNSFHSGIFQISKHSLMKNWKNLNAKTIIEYDYKKENIEKFINSLSDKISGSNKEAENKLS